MQTRKIDSFRASQDSKQNENLIDVLTAISIVSKRLAGRLTALEHQYAEKSRGGKLHDTRQNAATRE